MGLAVSCTLCCPSTDPKDNCIDAKKKKDVNDEPRQGSSHTNKAEGFLLLLGGLKISQ